MYQTGGTIKTLLDRVANREYLLPAIQREFVWRPEQVCALFDSILQGYPFGTFLFWRIKRENTTNYQFYDFVREYHERDNRHCQKLDHVPDRDFTAVLDGQQRITALNVGLRGSYAWKLSGKWWRNDDAFPTRRLYLNLVASGDEESNLRYAFEFLTEAVANRDTETQYWFRVGRVLEEDRDDLADELDHLKTDDRQLARKTLSTLFRTVHDQPKVSYYEEEQQDLDRVLNIFIRMNSGGTPLSYSDLLLSIAVAQWESLDAREEIHSLVDEMNQVGDGFGFTKDLVLKAGLMLSDIGNVGFKVENFNKTNMLRLESDWQDIRGSLLLAVQFLASVGFNGQNIRAASALLPIAYYMHRAGLNRDYLTRAEFKADRDELKFWLIKSILKASGIWGSGLDTLLTEIRRVIRESGKEWFPREKIEGAMAHRGKSLQFVDEEIDELAELAYGDRRTFSLLSIVFPGHDFQRHFHVDHIFPKSRMTERKLLKANFDPDKASELADKADRLPNLQLMEGTINTEKRSMLPHEWYEIQWPSPEGRQVHLNSQAIEYLPESIEEFEEFYWRRHQTLRARIAEKLM